MVSFYFTPDGSKLSIKSWIKNTQINLLKNIRVRGLLDKSFRKKKRRQLEGPVPWSSEELCGAEDKEAFGKINKWGMDPQMPTGV